MLSLKKVVTKCTISLNPLPATINLAVLPRDAMIAWYLLSCVCPSVRHKPVLYRNDWTNRAGFLAWRLPSVSATLSVKVIWVSAKISALPSWTFSQTSDFKKCRHGKSIALSTKLVVVDGRACWRHLYDSRRVVAVCYKSVNCNPPIPLLWLAVDLLYIQLVSVVDKISTDTVHRAVRRR